MKTKTKVILSVVGVVLLITGLLVFLGSSDERVEIGSPVKVLDRAGGGMQNSLSAMPMFGNEAEVQTKESTVGDVTPGSVSSVGKAQNDRKIIRSGRLAVVTKDVQKSVSDMSAFVSAIGGFVVSSDIVGTADNPSATLQVRVPVEKFEESIDQAGKSGIRVTSKSVSGEDVTEDFVDTQARIKNLQASEAQFAEIMKNAQKITDVLEVQRQLERVRGEIEVAQGHSQFLERSAKLSSITIYFAMDEGQLPVVDPVSAWNPLNIIKSAFRYMVGLAQGIGTLLIWLVVFIPLWLLIALVVYIVKKIAKRKTSTLKI